MHKQTIFAQMNSWRKVMVKRLNEIANRETLWIDEYLDLIKCDDNMKNTTIEAVLAFIWHSDNEPLIKLLWYHTRDSVPEILFSHMCSAAIACKSHRVSEDMIYFSMYKVEQIKSVKKNYLLNYLKSYYDINKEYGITRPDVSYSEYKGMKVNFKFVSAE